MKTMKTSNKLIAAAFLLVLVSLFVYDHLLKGEYLTKKYVNPYKSYTTLKFKNFDTVDLVSSTAANVKFIQGPFSVKIDPDALDYVRLKQYGGRLQINAGFEHNYLYNQNTYILIISCPKLAAVYASAIYTANNKQVIDTVVREDWNMRKVLISGFKEDSLLVKQDYGSTITLSNNYIHFLNAVTGIKQGSGSKIDIQNNNTFQKANLNILNRSWLLLKGGTIQNLEYHLADSAKMIISPAAQNLINNSKPQQK
jgi:hypothetical protein